MPNFPLAATVVASVLVTLATGSSVARTVPDFPLAVICFSEQTQTWRIGYLQEVSKDGSAVYVAVAGHFGLRWMPTAWYSRPQIAHLASTASARP